MIVLFGTDDDHQDGTICGLDEDHNTTMTNNHSQRLLAITIWGIIGLLPAEVRLRPCFSCDFRWKLAVGAPRAARGCPMITMAITMMMVVMPNDHHSDHDDDDHVIHQSALPVHWCE